MNMNSAWGPGDGAATTGHSFSLNNESARDSMKLSANSYW